MSQDPSNPNNLFKCPFPHHDGSNSNFANTRTLRNHLMKCYKNQPESLLTPDDSAISFPLSHKPASKNKGRKRRRGTFSSLESEDEQEDELEEDQDHQGNGSPSPSPSPSPSQEETIVQQETDPATGERGLFSNGDFSAPNCQILSGWYWIVPDLLVCKFDRVLSPFQPSLLS
jgi:hypothetical protein